MSRPPHLSSPRIAKLLLLSFVLYGGVACGNASDTSQTDGGIPVAVPLNGSTGTKPNPTTGGATGTETSRTQAYGVALQVGSGYLARRDTQVVYVQATDVEAAVAAGWTLEVTMLPGGKLAFDDRCLALEAAASENGTLRLQPCDNANVVELLYLGDGAYFTRLPMAGSGNVLQGQAPDTSTCPVASAASCRVGYSVDSQEAITLATSPLAPKDGPRGALLHAGNALDSCLTRTASGVTLTACDSNQINERWLFRSGPVGNAANSLLVATEAGDCLVAQGTSDAPSLTFGSCSTTTHRWIIIQSSFMVLYDGSADTAGNSYFLQANPATSSVSLASSASALPNQDSNARHWQIGPTSPNG